MNFFSNGNVSNLVFYRDDLADANAEPLKKNLGSLLKMLGHEVRISMREANPIGVRRLAIVLGLARTLRAEGKTVELQCRADQLELFRSLGMEEVAGLREVSVT